MKKKTTATWKNKPIILKTSAAIAKPFPFLLLGSFRILERVFKESRMPKREKIAPKNKKEPNIEHTPKTNESIACGSVNGSSTVLFENRFFSPFFNKNLGISLVLLACCRSDCS